MPFKGQKKRDYEKREIEKVSLCLPTFLHEALREKLTKEGLRTMHAFFVDAAAEYCGLTEQILKRRAPKTRQCKLQSPGGEIYDVENLKKFCVENANLFPSYEPEKAYRGLSQARKRGGTWLKWRFL